MNQNNKDSAQKKFFELTQRGAKFLGTKFPVVGGAMSWVSESNLVAAISNAGGFGVIACGSLDPQNLKLEIQKTKELTSKPFGVNLISMHPDINQLVKVCIDSHVTHIVLAGALPKSEVINLIKNAGVMLITFAPTIAVAKRMVRAGSDAIVVEGSEAGGHVGPVSTSVLAQEILPAIRDVPVFVAGGITRGEALSMYLRLGAAGIQMGTRFVCAKESVAHQKFKDIFIKSNSRDAILTVQLDPRFPVIPVRALSNKGTNLFNLKQREVIKKYERKELNLLDAQLEIEHFWAGALRRAVIEGDVDNGSVMAGQGIGMIKNEESLSKIMENFISQAISII